MTDEQYNAVMADLAVIKEQTKPHTSTASIGGFQGGAKPYVGAQPAPAPDEKSYAAALEQYGAKGNTIEEKRALLAKRIKERKAGYAESSPGIIGTWDAYPWVKVFMDEFPKLFLLQR